LGVPKEKILLGFAFAGNSYKIFDGKHNLGDPVKDVGIAGNVRFFCLYFMRF
jgi:hypothetical protein